LKRRAAIKMIRSGAGLSGEALRRFQTEAEAVAQAHHANIVQIYEVGWHDGQPFVALEYLAGGSLLAKVGTKPQPPREAAALLRVLANAMHHAHSHGVIHRDLKPANILFTEDGTPKISDFGAARLTQDEGAGAALTQIGEVIGTPQYMAPEQARGTPRAISPAVDVYALGAVLYHLLTGRPPHDGPDSFDILQSVVHSEPVAPRTLVPKIPRDLETIALKALEKHPGNRYVTAAAMAEDLGHFLAGESIQAKPDSAVVRLVKKARRRPLVAGLVAGIVLVALAGFSGVVWQWQHAETKSEEAEKANRAAQLAAQQAETEAGIARRETREKEENLYRSQVSEVALLLDSGDFAKANKLLVKSGAVEPGRSDPRHWEWHYLNRLGHNFLWMTEMGDHVPDHSLWTHAVAISPDAKYLAISGGDPYAQRYRFDVFEPATMFIIETATGRVANVWKDYLPEAAALVVWRDTSTLVTAMTGKGIRVLRVPDGKVLHEWDPIVGPQREPFNQEAGISPDGRFAYRATSPRALALYDTGTGETLRTFEFDAPIHSLPLVEQTATTWHLIVGTDSGTHIIDPRTGRTVLVVPGSFAHVAALDAAGTQAALLLRENVKDTKVRLEAWSLVSGARLWTSPRPPVGERCQYQYHPDGDRLAEVYNSGTALRVHHAVTGALEYEARGHTNRILDFQYSPDGRYIATASNDGSIRVWKGADEVAKMRGHGTGARVVVYDPNGWRLYSGGMDSRAFAWDLTRERTDGSRLPYSARQGPSNGGAFSGGLWIGPDGVARYLDTTNASLFSFDPATFTPRGVVTFEGMKLRPEKTATDFSLSADARYLIGPSSGDDHLPILWDAATGRIVRRMQGVTGHPWIIASALNADGSRAAATLLELKGPRQPVRQFMIWNAATGEVLHREVLEGFSYSALAFDPVRPRLYIGVSSMKSKEAGFHVFDLVTMGRSKVPSARSTLIRHVTVSPDGRLVAGIDLDQDFDGPHILAFEAADTTRGWVQEGVGPATGLAFSPDSRRLALARFDDALAIYDAASGTEVFFKAVPSNRHGDYAFPARVAFSPDGRSLAMNHSNAQLSVWRTDDWSASPAQRLDGRRSEAEAATYAFHLRAAEELAKQPGSAGFRFHAAWLDQLTPPNEFVEREWQSLKRPVAAGK
jgi:WD40 repeat protein